jgi:hypothetical protein
MNMEEQMYQLAQTGIYAGAVVLALCGTIKIYASARFQAANTKARSEAEQALAGRRIEALKEPAYLQLVNKRVEAAAKLSEENNLESDASDLEKQLDAICGRLI